MRLVDVLISSLSKPFENDNLFISEQIDSNKLMKKRIDKD